MGNNSIKSGSILNTDKSVHSNTNSKLGTSLPARLLLLVPNQSTKNLSTRTLRNGIHKSDTTLQEFVTSLVVLDMLDESLGYFLV